MRHDLKKTKGPQLNISKDDSDGYGACIVNDDADHGRNIVTITMITMTMIMIIIIIIINIIASVKETLILSVGCPLKSSLNDMVLKDRIILGGNQTPTSFILICGI